MATIVVLNGRHQGEWYTLNDGPKGLVFGRGEGLLAEIVDPRVSREHLRIHWGPREETYYAQDLGSHNGTRINGKPMQVHQLEEGDALQIGRTMLLFTERDFADHDEVAPFVEDARRRHGSVLDAFAEREPYTEAAALFSRIFRRRK